MHGHLNVKFNMKIRHQNSTEQEGMPTLHYRRNSSEYEFSNRLFMATLSLQTKQEFCWKYFVVNQTVQTTKHTTWKYVNYVFKHTSMLLSRWSTDRKILDRLT